MQVFNITDTITILRGEKDAEPKYSQTVSARIIQQFGKGPFPPDIQKEVFTFCQLYFVEEFEKTCEKETSFSFYREIFTLHEQATNLRASENYHNLPNGIDKQYISIYRRVLKMILEKGCDINMQSGEERDSDYFFRIQPVLNDLLYLGDMIFGFSESFAEFSMVEGISQVTFDDQGLYRQVREPHFDHVFYNISQDMERGREEFVIDPTSSEDFKAAIHNAFGFDYDKLTLFIAELYNKFELAPPDCLTADKHNFIMDAANAFGVLSDSVALFFSGLILNRKNKMPLVESVRRPYSLNRFLYRPFLEWEINGVQHLICGIYSIVEAEYSLTLNAIPWGKFPNEWGNSSGIKDYVSDKHNAHDGWLDDQVEKIVKKCGLHYDRGLKKIHTKTKSFSLLEKSLGEIDFLIISPSTQKVLVAECKHLLGRYDMVSWKQDFDKFTEDGPQGYNTRIASKVMWIVNHLPEVEEHFRIKYKDNSISLNNYEVEGVFVINTPTFYMYNAPYRIYTYHQFENVITGQHTDPVYSLLYETDQSITTYWVKYPYFAKRELRYFDSGDDDGEVDKYGFPITKPGGDGS